MKTYTVSWHEKKDPSSSDWKFRNHVITDPDLVKMFLNFNKELSELLFSDNHIWGLQMTSGKPTIPYKERK